MNKKIYILGLYLLLIQFIFAEKVLISPIIIQDSYGRGVEDIENFTINIEEKLRNDLESYWFEVFFEFETLEETEVGKVLTILDARNICLTKNEEYIIYGYIQQNDKSWYGNLKLYSKSHKKILKEFFSSDDILSYERFCNTLINNVAYGLKDVAGIEEPIVKDDLTEPFSLGISISSFYWNPLDPKWNNALMGIVGGQLGVELFMPHKRKVSNYFDTSIRLLTSYSFGKEVEGSYPLNLHSIQFNSSLLERFHFNKNHAIYVGCGPYYELELLTVLEKYKDAKTYMQNMFGSKAILGYELTINKFLVFGTEVAFDFHFSNDFYVSIKPSILMTINVYRGEK